MCVSPTRDTITERVSPPGVPLEDHLLVIVKPDGVRRGLTGWVIDLFTKVRMELVVQRTIWATREEIGKLLRPDDVSVLKVGIRMVEHFRGREEELLNAFGTTDPRQIALKIREKNLDYLSSGPIIVLVFRGKNAVRRGKAFKEAFRKVWGCESSDRDQVYLTGRAWKNALHTASLRELEHQLNWVFEVSPDSKEELANAA